MRTHLLFFKPETCDRQNKEKGKKSKHHSIRNGNKQELRWEHKAESDSSKCGHEQHEMKNNSKVTDSTQERTSQYNWHAQRKQTDTSVRVQRTQLFFCQDTVRDYDNF